MYGFHDGGVVQFLCFVYFVAAGHPSGMVVSDVGMIILYGADHVPFHDCMWLDIVEQLKAFGAMALQEIHAPGGMIALIIM